MGISIHALRKESDSSSTVWLDSSLRFQSTLSVRRATYKDVANTPYFIFQSTLSVRRATGLSFASEGNNKFQSTLSVRRATIGQTDNGNSWTVFQSTLSVRRATVGVFGRADFFGISIHALRKESDPYLYFLLL